MKARCRYLVAMIVLKVIFILYIAHKFYPVSRSRFMATNLTTRNEQSSTITTNVILLAYMRSGSSLTGDIIQESPDVFYIFEPLYYLTEKRRVDLVPQRAIHYRDKNITIKSSEEIFPLYIQTMKAIFSCWFEDLDNGTLQVRQIYFACQLEDLTNGTPQVRQIYFACRLEDLDNGTLQQAKLKRSKTTVPAFKCIRENKTAEPQWQRLLRCHQTTNTSCRSARFRAVKTIRLGMQHVEALLPSVPNLKIIHLVRDPRAIINSRLYLNLTGELIQYDQLCNRIMEDLERSKKISKIFPGRILTVRYEDLAESPLAAARQMYSFVGLQMNSEIEQYIWNITHADFKNIDNYGTSRANSTAAANTWRHKLDYQIILDIQKTCTRLLDVLGYRSFQSKDAVVISTLSSTYKLYDPELMKLSI